MDNFMDKVAQKLNSQEIIRANAAADAAALENLERQLALFKEQMEKYDECLQEMRRLNLKNIESAQDIQELAVRANEKLGQMAGEVEEASLSRIKEASELSIAGISRTLEESLAKIAEIKDNPESLEQIIGNLGKAQEKTEEAFKSLEDYLHTDNVKVYRNVQASMIEELGKQTEEIKEGQEKLGQGSRKLMPFVVGALVFSAISMIINILGIFGLF
ncbi:hypothetical protein IMSAGC019_00577 [Lachnospiraceae bacterium]|nr:hypothetical protein IMSAGC019_00577 [Lachnospiraceae bacterium]